MQHFSNFYDKSMMSETESEDKFTSTTSAFREIIPKNNRACAVSKCGYCGDECTESHKKLQPCLFCGTVAYCSKEHQQVDWKTHKMVCKAVQEKGIVPFNPTEPSTSKDVAIPQSIVAIPQFTNLGSDSIQLSSSLPNPTIPPFSGESSAFRPYRSTIFNPLIPAILSSLSGINWDKISIISPPVAPPQPPREITVPIRVITKNEPKTEPKSEPMDEGERIIETDDPDIQIIEGGSSCQSRNHARARKRPTPTGSADIRPKYKDHNKNLVYSTTIQEHQKHLQNKGLALNLHQAMILRLRYISEHVIRSLNEFGWAVVDNFLGKNHTRATAQEIESLYTRGLFSAGQLMEAKNKDEVHIKDIRSDRIYWYDGNDPRAHGADTVRLLISMIDSVIQHFKQRIDYNIGGRSRAMLAIYPGNGTRYVKHVDNPVKDGRCITTIYYCNENWDMGKDGGTLRLYPETSMTPMDIDPRADRLVFFWSDRRNPHEVMPVYKPRYAITIWYMDKEEREKALARSKEEAAAKKKAQLSEDALPAKKNLSSQDLSSIDLRLFQTTTSAPVLSQENEKISAENEVTTVDSVSHQATSTDSGISLSNSNPYRSSSLQSVSDQCQGERSGERRSSTSSDTVDFEVDLTNSVSTFPNPEYQI
ncbi:unnamed protein product [Caenorhabditis bovis]|uniref:hypoxia-inducible factor-proline dioxygenase n=1 Tax=Caenorhabditis bovis TaxID=2654633 RepID=A0A8S1ECU1_9PELO|nr:unnamed protein product [Caenorhabditis bovis]